MNQRLILSSVFLLTSLYSVAQDKNPLVNSQQAIDAGVKFHEEGKYKEALKEYQKVKAGDTNYVRALYEMAMSCGADSQFTQGLRYCEEALASSTDKERTPALLVQYANLLDYDKQRARALKLYDSAIAVYPAELLLYINKGTTLIRAKQYKDAEKVFQQALLINPYSASAHCKLGICAINQGKVIPAYLALMGSLLMDPESNFAASSIQLLDNIAKSKDDVLELVNKRTEGPSENFRLVEEILLSKIALDKSYKTLLKLDDPISRQMQVLFEKISFDANDADFYMQYYVPWFKKVFDEKKFELLVNYLFRGVNIPAIKDFNKKKKKEIEKLTDGATEYFTLIRSTRELQVNKRNTEGPVYLFDHGQLLAKGASRNDGSVLLGAWDYFYPGGNLKGKGAFNDKGQKEGPWVFYHFNGQVKIKKSFVADKQEGEELAYYDNGAVESRAMFKNGVVEGQFTSYYRSGKPNIIENYKNGKVNGVKTTLYESGAVKAVSNFEDDKLNGPFKTWYQNGQLEAEGSYANDKVNGLYKEWYAHGALQLEAQYQDGEVQGVLKRYHENGKLSSEETYNKGVLEGDYARYYDNGQLINKYVNKKGKVNGEVSYYDKDGKLYATLTFDNDKLKSARYFNKTGKEISASQSANGKLNLLSWFADGTKRALVPYNEKGLTSGKQVLYYGSGKEKEVSMYVDDELHGNTISYHPNGKQKFTLDYTEGERNGYYTAWYQHGAKEEEGWYKDDVFQGEWLTYNEYGVLSTSTYYLNGDLNGVKSNYFPSGKKESERFYNMGILEGLTEYDSTGKIINQVKLPDGTGDYLSVYLNGKPYSKGKYVQGSPEGEFKFFYFDGSSETLEYFKSGNLDSTYKSWHYGGQLSNEGQYKAGNKVGVWKNYRLNGKLQYTDPYNNAGQVHGIRTFYHNNGNVDTEVEFAYGERTGWTKKYDEDGSLAFQMRYEEGVPVAYTYNDKNGKLVPEIPMPRGNGKVNTFYANGQPSLSVEYIDGVQHGVYKLYHSNGKVALENTEYYGDSEGPFTEYQFDGSKRFTANYRFGNLHGPTKEYNAKGILIFEGNYYNGALHGERRVYDDNGKLKKVETYYYGQLLSVK